jgi:predicted  nucleic acid-binding Zn-ribbon protein
MVGCAAITNLVGFTKAHRASGARRIKMKNNKNAATQTATPASPATLTAAQELKQIQERAKALRAQAKAERDAQKGTREAESVEVARKYIAIFTDRRNRMAAKIVKLDETIAGLAKRLPENKAKTA